MSADRIDVLAVMRDAAATLHARGNVGVAANLTEARPAVAELIAAAREVVALECGAHVARLNIALARVGGAA